MWMWIALGAVAAEIGECAPRGEEIFHRAWVQDDPRSFDGDGLGQGANGTSCVGCHNQGGPGGGGPAAHNVGGDEPMPVGIGRFAFFSTRTRAGSPGRQPTALFGAGEIDRIGDWAIVLAVEEQRDEGLGLSGRLGRTASGDIARFGWKGDVASLSDFVHQACKAELGVNTPVGILDDAQSEAGGTDLSAEEVGALIDYVAGLPRPEEAPSHPVVEDGRYLFDNIGCTGCHRPSLGGVDGIYADLLLHDLGGTLSDAGLSWGAAPTVARVVEDGPAGPSEWRTPPLWGLRDSAPYLHDGRARTVRRAIDLHGGEATRSAWAFGMLPPEDQQRVLDFLDTLVAPHPSRFAAM